MKLSALLHQVDAKAEMAQEVEISGITDCSANVEKGNLFVCIPGRHVDGHTFAAQAAARGAAALVTQRLLPLPLPQLVVADPRRAYAQLCAAFFGNPARQLRIAAITGTNGKTTTAWLLRSILEQNGRKTGLIGTIPEEPAPLSSTAHYTTPAPPELHRRLRQFADHGVHCVVMEASSQAVSQERLAGIHFCCGAFMNLSPEHMDYHPTMEAYYQAKRKLFQSCDCAVINIDSPWGARLTREVPCRTVTVSAAYPMADYVIGGFNGTASDMEFTLRHQNITCTVRLPMISRYHAYNAACAIACAAEYGVPLRAAAVCLENAPTVPGRLEHLALDLPFDVYLDYAHTPEALEQTLRAMRAVCRGRLICLFGCGGDRDRTKRPVMGEIAARLSDAVVLTNDNPRTENEAHILDEIEAGMGEAAHRRIPDRSAAIRAAIAMAEPGDMVLIAGKGHEQYQILADGCHPFDERRIAAQAAAYWKEERTV